MKDDEIKIDCEPFFNWIGRKKWAGSFVAFVLLVMFSSISLLTIYHKSRNTHGEEIRGYVVAAIKNRDSYTGEIARLQGDLKIINLKKEQHKKLDEEAKQKEEILIQRLTKESEIVLENMKTIKCQEREIVGLRKALDVTFNRLCKELEEKWQTQAN